MVILAYSVGLRMTISTHDSVQDAKDHFVNELRARFDNAGFEALGFDEIRAQMEDEIGPDARGFAVGITEV